jgi:hypoxanthine phosphoribosyltransferase
MSTNPKWRKNVEILFDNDELQSRIGALGAEITASYAGETITLVGILKGSFIFYADLVRSLDLAVRCEFIGISSYGDNTESSGIVKITHDLTHSIEGEHVLIVEDIIDTGLTMRYLLENLATRKPASLKVCTLLHKPANSKVEVPMDWIGFTIPNKFVVGYGLDFAGIYRNLPFIGVYNG